MLVSRLPYPPVRPRTSITVKAEKEMTTTGSHSYVEETVKGFYFERHAWVQNTEGKKVESQGQVIIFHDICTEVEKLSGVVIINGSEKHIATAKRLKNPDGTVHHVELELM